MALRKRSYVAESKLTKASLNKPWTINASQWLSLKGIHEPWISEISPYQYAQMGKAAKARYDKKRNAEWQASADGKQAWVKAVYDTHKAGKFELTDKDVHPDARGVTTRVRIQHDKKRKEDEFEKAQNENQIKKSSELKVGDTVYSVFARRYAKVVKVMKKNVKIESEFGGLMTQKPLALQWLSYNDLKKKVFGE